MEWLRLDRFEWMVLSAVLGAGLLGFALFLPQPAAAPIVVETPTMPTAVSQGLPTRAPTLAPTGTAAPTASPIPPSPSPAPSPTLFWVVPQVVAVDPTPVLASAAPFPTSCDGPGRMHLLILGIDGFSNDYTRPARADAVMLLGIDFGAKTAELVSFPRDLWVPLPGGLPVAEARLNSAYHYGELYGAPGGGPAEVTAVMQATFGVRVDRTVVASFLAFEQAVDTLGGIEIDIPTPIRDPNYPRRSAEGTIVIEFPAGRVRMDGGTALIYARIRHDSSDFQRMRRQQQVLFAVRDRLLSAEALPHLPALAQLAWSSVRTDLSLEDLALLGCVGPQIDRANIRTTTINESLVTPTRLADGAQVLMPRLDQILPLLANFR